MLPGLVCGTFLYCSSGHIFKVGHCAQGLISGPQSSATALALSRHCAAILLYHARWRIGTKSGAPKNESVDKWSATSSLSNVTWFSCHMILMWCEFTIFFFAPLAIALSCPAPSFYPCANSAGARTPNLDTQKYLRFGLIEYCVTVCLNVDLLVLKYCVIVSLKAACLKPLF